jgi:peptide/nickel transport system permease protein
VAERFVGEKRVGFGRFLTKRLVVMFVLLFVIVNLQFVIFQVVSPLDPVELMISPGFSAESRAIVFQLYGLDKPLLDRYFLYLMNLYTFKFGISFLSRQPVLVDIITYLPNTLYLVGLAMGLELVIGIVAGLTAASRRGKAVDVIIVTLGLASWALPAFILQLFFRFLFSDWLRIFPFGMMTSYPPPSSPFGYFQDLLYHTFLPLTTLVLMGFGSWAFYTRNLLIDVLTQDYILTARAKGVSERTVVSKHAFRVILPPIVTMVLMNIPSLLAGSIITEYIFTWPGLGSWLVNATLHADYPAVQALFFIYSIMMLACNFLADVLYGYLDPRIRVGMRR